MIHPKAVKAFLKSERDNHVWMKGLSNKKLDRALEDLGFIPMSPKPLRKHQKVSILLGLAYPHFAFWLDMGTGKSRVLLELLQHFWNKGRLHRAMITATSDDSIRGWEKQIKKWRFKVPYIAIGNSSTAAKWTSIAELGAGLIITTYPGYNWLFASKQKVKKRGTKKLVVKMKPDKKKIKAFSENLDAAIWDESPHVGNHQSVGWKISTRLSKHCRFRYALAGLPFGKDPTLVWAQQFLVDRGESLGPTLGLFRQVFFTEKQGYFTRFEYKYRTEMEDTLREMMGHRSITYASDECLDLPKVTSIVLDVKLPMDAQAYFDQAVKSLRQARGDLQKIQNTFLRMRQMSSGFLGYKDDETGERASLVFAENPKLDLLMSKIEDMPENCKFVIFHEFTHSGRTIMEAMKARGIKAGWLWSGSKNTRKMLDSFDDDDPSKMKGLVCQWRKASESLEFQRANYLHYYESPVGVIARKQSEKRPFRDGQTRKGFMYDYVATPADRRIIQFHKTGDDLWKAMRRDPSILAGD